MVSLTAIAPTPATFPGYMERFSATRLGQHATANSSAALEALIVITKLCTTLRKPGFPFNTALRLRTGVIQTASSSAQHCYCVVFTPGWNKQGCNGGGVEAFEHTLNAYRVFDDRRGFPRHPWRGLPYLPPDA